MNHPIQERPLSDLRETYASFRLIGHKAEAAMEQSLDRYGQISPLLCLPTIEGPEVLDGFKRLRACRCLEWPTVQVMFLPPPAGSAMTSSIAGKLAMIRLNRLTGNITDLEEAMILEFLHQEEGVPQATIALVAERTQKWLRLWFKRIGDLHEDVRRHIMAGSISVEIGLKLGMLPRNSQPLCLWRILKHHMKPGEVEKVIRHLLAHSGLNPSAMVDSIAAAPAADVPMPASSRRAWFRRLVQFRRMQRLILAGAVEETLPESSQDEWLLRDVIKEGQDLRNLLNHLLTDDFNHMEILSWKTW